MSTSAVGSSGSMIDVNGIVSGLMALEQRPLQTIKSRVSATQVSVSSMSEVRGLVSAAYNAAKALNASSLLSGKSITSSSDALVKVSVTDSTLAAAGAVAIKPVELARAQRSTLAGFASASEPLAALDENGVTQFGALTIDIPANSTLLGDTDGDGQTDSFAPVEIALGGRTLTEVRDAINTQLSGKLSASIINTGDAATGYVLVIAGAKTGAEADFTVSLDADTLAARASSGLKLGADAAAQATITLGETVAADLAFDAAADDAYAELYSGTGHEITVRSTSNTFSSVLPGVSFELMKKPAAGETASATVTVAENTADVEAKLTSFASAYSDMVKRLRVLTRAGSADQQAGPLAANAGVLSLTSAISASYFKGIILSDSRTYTTAAGSVVGGASSPIAWSSLGLKMARDGTVTLDAAELRRTLASGLGASIREGFAAELTETLNTYGGSGTGLQSTIQTMERSLSTLRSRQSDLEDRLERTRQGLVKKYAALDAKLTQMNQMSTNVRSALAGLAG